MNFSPAKEKPEGKNINKNWHTECYSSSERKKTMIQTGENEVLEIYKSMDSLSVTHSLSSTDFLSN